MGARTPTPAQPDYSISHAGVPTLRHVGFNLLFLVPGETGGMEVAARRTIAALTELAPADYRFTAFVNRETADEELGVEKVVLPVCSRSRLQWVRGEQLLLSKAVKQARCDLLHSLGSTAPAHGDFLRVTTVHDLNYKLVPEAHLGLRAWGMKLLVPLAVSRSHRIIADSASTRDDLIEHLGTAAAKIDVVHLAADAPADSVANERDIRREFGLGERPALLSLSAKRPHKNLELLLEALAKIDSSQRPITVFAGYNTPYEQQLRATAARLGLADDVRWVHWLSQAQIEGLFALAKCFVFPSLYEGFGLPVLEAMQRGVPVACSDRGSLPEIAGDAALLFDPTNADELKTAIERLLGDPDLARELTLAGRRRAAEFSWRKTAQQTLASYERTFAAVPTAP